MNTYNLSIITPLGKIFNGQVSSIVAPGTSGSFGILAHHAPMVASLRDGPLTIREETGNMFYKVHAGVLEVDSQSDVLLLADGVEQVKSLEDAKKPLSLKTDNNLN